MTVKTLGTLARGLRVLEAIAAHQPVGLTHLARLMDEDKSALQRTLATLHGEGWIRPLPDSVPRWEVSNKPLVVASAALVSSPLPVRARALVGTLRDATGETAYFTMLEGRAMVVVDVAEGAQVVRTALQVGRLLPLEGSAVGHVLFAHLDADERAVFAVAPAAGLDEDTYADIRTRGWSLSEGSVKQGTTSIAAAVLEGAGRPIGAVVVSGPDTRFTPERYAEIGGLTRDAAAELSSRRPSP